jgi:hypothetical protein
MNSSLHKKKILKPNANNNVSKLNRNKPHVPNPPMIKKDEKRVVVTINIGDYEKELANVSIPLMKYYAKKCNADFIEINDSYRTRNEHPCFMKQRIQNILELGLYERALYLDLDVIVNPNSPNIFEQVPYNCLGARNDTKVFSTTCNTIKRFKEYIKEYNVIMNSIDERPLLAPWNESYYNAGIFLCNKWTNPHIKPIAGIMRVEIPNSTLFDQNFFNAMILLYNIPVFDIGWKFNRTPMCDIFVKNTDMLKDSYFIHYAGARRYEKFNADYPRIKEFLKQIS